MSKPRVPLTKGIVNSSNRNPDSHSFASSDLLHYGFATQDQKSSNKGSKEKTKGSNEKYGSEKPAVKKRSSKEELLAHKNNTMEEDGPDGTEDGCLRKDSSNIPTPAHLNLSQAQLNALSYSLSELADKISPTKNEFFDEDELLTAKGESFLNDRSNSLGRSKIPGDTPNTHSKTPYSRRHGHKHHLSKQKSFNIKKLPAESKLPSDADQVSNLSEIHLDHDSAEKEDATTKTVSPVQQESVESGYNSSWSASSISWSEDLKDANKNNANADTDVDVDFKDESSPKKTHEDDENTEDSIDHTKILQTKISDIENRINSLILGRRSSDLESTETINNCNLEEKEVKIGKDSKKDVTEDTNGETNSTTTDSVKNEQSPVSGDTESGVVDLNQNNNETTNTLDNTKNGDLKKSPFQVLKVRKASLDDASLSQRPKRPGLVRRRTTLVTFRPPRKASAFTEVDDSGVLEIDEAGFIQCLTDVRAMKTMLLKLKRELQEAEVQSPLARSKSVASRNMTILANNSGLSETADEGSRRHTYDSSEMIHEKLRRIRSQSISRIRQSSCLESPLEDQSAETPDDVTVQTPSEMTEKSKDDGMKKMKEDLDDLKEKMKALKQERDTLFMDKEEIEHELETKNHTITLLQKQLEVQENNDEVTYLQRQVTALTQQVRQQQQKIAELKYRATSPSSTPVSLRKGSVKLDIKNRLRDAFARHLEESSKSHLLLSKHIEKAEFTISEAQKGDLPSRKIRSSTTVLGTPRDSEEEMRRHSWTANSIERIIKTWKETTQSIENLTNRSPKPSKKSSKLPQPDESSGSSPHLSFL